MLVGIPNAPSAYAPTKSPGLAAQHQAQVVQRMPKYGYLPPQRLSGGLRRGIAPLEGAGAQLQPHLRSRVA